MSELRNCTAFYIITYAECVDTDNDWKELSARGKKAVDAVEEVLKDVHFDAFYSSPALQAIRTVSPIAFSRGIGVEVVHDFCTQRLLNSQMCTRCEFCKMSWEEVVQRLQDDADFREAQERCVGVLTAICRKFRDRSVLLGTHFTILTLLFDKFMPDFRDFEANGQIEPHLVKFEFRSDEFIKFELLEWSF
ncbi:MAG: histidine phosphatase family protein [Clostridiales bacterium]|nr:histidine phosphatase family protein [Clostridiales bacterium]